MREKTELSKEERQAERASKKRKAKTSAHNKSIHRKEQLRQQGLQLAERFVVKETKRHMEKMQKKGKKGQQEEGQGKRTNSSAKVFKNLQSIVADDYKRKEDKKQAKLGSKRTHAETTSANTKKYML